MAKPEWITIGTVEGSMNGSSEITAAAHTGRVAREGDITVTAAGGATDTTAVSQVGAEEVITIETKEYSANAVGQNITIQGKSNSADLNIVDIVSLPGTTFKLAVAGVTDESWNGKENITVAGDPGASAIYDFTLTVTIPENKSESTAMALFAVKNANGDVTSGEITINQAAGVKNYAVPIISSVHATQIPARGGSEPVIVEYSQTWGWNESNSNGGTLTAPIAGATFTYTGQNVSESGVVTFPSKGTVVSDETKITISATVTVNGKTSAVVTGEASQAANFVAFYDDVKFKEARVPSVADIPASGGSVDKANITWSGEGAIVEQKIYYASDAVVTISNDAGSVDPVFDAIKLTYSDSITAASKGTAVSARTEAGVITITATGADSKTATKSLTVYQAANIATYGEVTIGQATPVSLAASGETYQIVPALKQTVTYTSGVTRTEATPADNKVQLSANYAVKTAKEGFSLETNTGKVTVSSNPTSVPREGFVVTISAEGEGGKTATKDITFYQLGSASTINISPDTLSFIAAGETKTVTITSNDSWTLS